jgi:hypothetical protein
MITPKPTPKKKLTESQKREEILKQHQKRISPEGVAAADAAAKKALEERYPGMFIPQTRTSTRINRGN